MSENPEGNQPQNISFHNDTKDGKRILSFLFGLCFLLISSTLLYFGISFTISVVHQLNLNAIFNAIKYYAFAALGSGLIFLLFSIKAFPPKPMRLDLTPTSLLLIKGRKSIQFKWSEVELIRFKITRHLVVQRETKQSCKIWIKSTKIKKPLVLNDFVNLNLALTIIRERAFPFLYTRILNFLKEGKPIIFGQILINQISGFSIQARHYSWQDIRSVQIKNGRVLIWNSKGKVITNCRISKIPNLDVLLSIIQDKGIDVLTI